MPEGVIDALELIKIHKKEGAAPIGCHSPRYLVLQGLREVPPIRQASKGVIISEPPQHFIPFVQRADRRLQRVINRDNLLVPG